MSALSVSIIIPTYNEAACIADVLRSLNDLSPREIIVADGGSGDGTPEIARPLAQVVTSEPGRGVQMNAGAAVAAGDVLLFLHADVRLDLGALIAIQEAMADPDTLGGDLDIRYDGDGTAARVFTVINRARRRFGVFYGDSGIFCRREVFQQLGGYKPYPILEDYEFARRMWKAGKLALLDEPIYVSDRRWRNSSLFRTLWSWFWIQGLYLCGVSPERLLRMYRNIR